MSEILNTPLVRWLKNELSEVTRLRTNSRTTAVRWLARTNKKDGNGYILRETQEEAENDPTP